MQISAATTLVYCSNLVTCSIQCSTVDAFSWKECAKIVHFDRAFHTIFAILYSLFFKPLASHATANLVSCSLQGLAVSTMEDDQYVLPTVVCAGLACVDMELRSCEVPLTRETVTRFGSVTYALGGSAPQTARALALFGVHVAAVYPVADDAHGRMLSELLRNAGVTPHAVALSFATSTSLAVLPVFTDGGRGCFVSLGANLEVEALDLCKPDLIHDGLGAFHFGYPHLMPKVQDDSLRNMFDHVRAKAPRVLLSLDLNGADISEGEKAVVSSALAVTNIVHANLEEACIISGLTQPGNAEAMSANDILKLVKWFCDTGGSSSPVVVCITCGRDGVVTGSGTGDDFRAVHRPAYAIRDVVEINASGAGDAFAAGALMGLMLLRRKQDCANDANGSIQNTCSNNDYVVERRSMSQEDLSFVADAGLFSALLRLDRDSVPNLRQPLKFVQSFMLNRNLPRITARETFADLSISPTLADAPHHKQLSSSEVCHA